MENSTQLIKTLFEEFMTQEEKFAGGNSSAGTRARKALGDLGKATKARRAEITAEKNARKEAKDTKVALGQ